MRAPLGLLKVGAVFVMGVGVNERKGGNLVCVMMSLPLKVGLAHR